MITLASRNRGGLASKLFFVRSVVSFASLQPCAAAPQEMDDDLAHGELLADGLFLNR